MTCQEGQRNRHAGGGDRGPEPRLGIGIEVEHRAEAEGDRQPGQQASRRDLGDGPVGQDLAEPVDAMGQLARDGAPPGGGDGAGNGNYTRPWSRPAPRHATTRLQPLVYVRPVAGCG